MKKVCNTLKSISNDTGLELFRTIAIGDNKDTVELKSKLKLTRKQYYSRMSALIKAGLVTRNNGNYSLTSFGSIVYDAQKKIQNSIENYWKLKTIDKIQLVEIPSKEKRKIIDTMVNSSDIRHILTSVRK